MSAVRDGSNTLTGWTLNPGGTLYRSIGWPVGVLQVDLTHGYDRCPPDLLPVIALAAQQRDPSVSSTRVGEVAVTYRDGSPSLRLAVDAYAAWSGIA